MVQGRRKFTIAICYSYKEHPFNLSYNCAEKKMKSFLFTKKFGCIFTILKQKLNVFKRQHIWEYQDNLEDICMTLSPDLSDVFTQSFLSSISELINNLKLLLKWESFHRTQTGFVWHIIRLQNICSKNITAACYLN